MTDPYSLFWPQEIGPYEGELHRLCEQLSNYTDGSEAIKRVRLHLQQIPDYPSTDLPRLRYRAYLYVLLDLLRQGWIPTCRMGRLYLMPPAWANSVRDSEEARAQKQAIRAALSHERLTQFCKPAVRQFIEQMERPRAIRNRATSIRSLFADGGQLAHQLATAIALPNEETQGRAVQSVIRPYLQLVTPKARCSETGFALSDIWRYLRYTWSIPYRSTPGRNMYYLVRDAAQAYHPIIGIAALGNSMMQITPRDDTIGWTPKAMLRRIRDNEFTEDEAEAIARMLQATLRDTLNDLATGDLLNPDEMENPTATTLANLEQIEKAAREQRILLLRERRQLHTESPVEPLHEILLNGNDSTVHAERLHTVEQQAFETLFRAKRARTLRVLLAARLALTTTHDTLSTVTGLRQFVNTEQGAQTLRTLVRENKKRRVGINMMDIIVCGSLPPYNMILGGKLVAMLIASPQVIWDYKAKYKGYVSHIASRMKQQQVLRDPTLVFLGTTSLYHLGSSQYNRIAIPTDRDGAKLTYQRLGMTVGYGSVHYSSETLEALNELQTLTKAATLINNRFGEGVNPKFRRMSTGLSLIGLEKADHFMNHRSKRIVYGVPLGEAAYEFLRGETDDPRYFFKVESKEEVVAGTQRIIQHWAERWLLMRIKQPEILAKMSSWSVEDFLLSNLFDTLPEQQQLP